MVDAATAKTADDLQNQSEQMTEDVSNAGNALLQAGMGKLAQVGGRQLQSGIANAGGGVNFARTMGQSARSSLGSGLNTIKQPGGFRTFASQTANKVKTGFRVIGQDISEAGGVGGYARQAGKRMWRELTTETPKEFKGRDAFSRDFLVGEGKNPTGALDRMKAGGWQLKLRIDYPEHEFTVIDNKLKINNQIEIHPSKLKELAEQHPQDFQNLLNATKELSDVGGDLNALSSQSKENLKKLSSSGSHRLRFDYQLQGEVADYVKKLGLEHEPLFQNMSNSDRARLYDLVNNAKGLSTKEPLKGLHINREQQAVSYALAQNPQSVSEFVNHFEFYKADLTIKLQQRIANYEARFNQEAINRGWTPESLSSKQKETLHKQISNEIFSQQFTGKKQVDAEYLKQLIEESGTPTNKGQVTETVKGETQQAYEAKASVVRGRIGSDQIDPKLPPKDMIEKIKQLDELKFSDESTGAYHAHKHYKELPPSHRTSGNEVEQYLESASQTIKNSTPEYSVDQSGNHIFTFRSTYSEGGKPYSLKAIARVSATGKVNILTYFQDN